MKTKELVLICRYSEEEICIAQIVRSSFEIFLRKELQHVEKHLSSVV